MSYNPQFQAQLAALSKRNAQALDEAQRHETAVVQKKREQDSVPIDPRLKDSRYVRYQDVPEVPEIDPYAPTKTFGADTLGNTEMYYNAGRMRDRAERTGRSFTPTEPYVNSWQPIYDRTQQERAQYNFNPYAQGYVAPGQKSAAEIFSPEGQARKAELDRELASIAQNAWTENVAHAYDRLQETGLETAYDIVKAMTGYQNWLNSAPTSNGFAEAPAREVPAAYKEIAQYFSVDKLNALRSTLEAAGVDVDLLLEYDRRTALEPQAQAREARAKAQANNNPFLSSLKSIPVAALQGLDLAAFSTGRGSPKDLSTYIPVNQDDMILTGYVNAIRNTVSDDLARRTKWGNVSSFLYQTGMSMLDSYSQIVALGPASLVFMGASAAANTAKESLARGATNAQAFINGIAAGVAEALFEKVSLDKLLEPKSITSIRRWVWETLKQGGVEASEELATEVSNIITDTILMRGLSNNELSIARYMKESGLSRAEAEKKVFWENMAQIGLAGAGGFLSGVGMGAMQNARNYITGAQSAAEVGARLLSFAQTEQGQREIVKGLIDSGLESDKKTDSYKLAKEYSAKLSRGQELTPAEIGYLFQANEAAIDAEIKTQAEEQKRKEHSEEIVRKLGLKIGVPASTTGAASVDTATENSYTYNGTQPTMEQATEAYMSIDSANKIKASAAKAKAGIIAKVWAGATLTPKEVRALSLGETKMRDVFQQLTGVELPSYISTTLNMANGAQSVADMIQQQFAQKQQAQSVAQQRAEVAAQPAVQPEGDPGDSLMRKAEAAGMKPTPGTPIGDPAAGIMRMAEESETFRPNFRDVRVMIDDQLADFNEFMRQVRARAGAESATDAELRQGFLDLAHRQGRLNDVSYNRLTEEIKNGGEETDGVRDDRGLQRDTGERSDRSRGGLSEETGGAAETEGSRTAAADAGRGSGSEEIRGDLGQSAQSERDSVQRRSVSEEANAREKVNLDDAPTDTVTYDGGRVSLRQITDDFFAGTQTYKTWARKAAALGVDIHGMLGLATIPGGHANGHTSLGGQSTAQLDHWQYTGDQIMGHELGHQIKFRLPDAYAQAHDSVFGQMTAQEHSDLITAYAGKFGKAYKAAGYSDSEIVDILEEEILCDAYGQMDRGETEASKYHDIVAPIFDAALEARAQELGIGAETAADVAENKYSISSIFRAVGFDNISLEGGRVIVRDQNGDIIRNVTRANVEQSYLGQMIRYAQNQTKTISAEDAGKQIQGIKDLLNLMIHAQDGDLVWKFAGAAMFSAVRSNSDAQYSTTIDFSTVCRKTKDMMETLSSTMKKLDRGLSRDEVVRLQKDIIEEHGQVPCPVCYVFSRWAGVGGILQNMADFQEKYKGKEWDDPTRVQARIDELRAATRTKKDLRAYLQQQDDEYMALSAAQEQAQAEIKQLKKDRTALNRIKNKTEVQLQQIQQINEAIESLQHEVDQLKKDLKEIEDKGAPEAAWLERVRIKPDYWEHGYVSHDVLYDLVNADRMAAEAPLAWSYRTTRGPAAGKAILPYSDYRLGDLIMGPKAAPGQTLFQNEGNTGALTGDQLKAINAAIRKTKAQNLIGGQRYQSTSDFRYDYGLDYLLSFFEGQALGMKLQCYTKVVEFAEIVASLGGDVNLSVMPFGKGYETVTLPDGRTINRLVYSSVTGMNPDAAIKASQMYDNAQLILVGINDEHILAALEDSPETGGVYVGFVIPYHASGASVNNFIRGLVEHLGESFNVEYYRDYSPVQNDAEKKNRAKEQEQRAELRKHLLTGKSGGKNWTPSEADLELLRGQNADITGRSFDDLRAVELAALNGDKAAIKEYLSWSAGVLRDVYLKMWADQTAEDTYDVRLTNSQAEHIMPHEYWNPDTTRQNAYVNGFIFRSYCYSLGLTPRFARSVKGADGVYYGDLSGSTGYWKTLIDRPMYANDGSYRPQQAINVTNLSKSFSEKDAGMLAPEYAERNWAGFTVPDSPADISERASERFIREQSASRYSTEEPTETDRAFVERFNEFQTQRTARGGRWTGKEFDSFFAAHPEYDFVQRFYTNDKAVKTDLQRFLSTIGDHELLDQMAWYTTQSHYDKAYRGSVAKVRNQYKNRINQLAAEQANGREIKLEHRAYTLDEVRKLFDELNANDDIRALADKVFARAEQIAPNIYASNQVLGEYNANRLGTSVGRDIWLRAKAFADKGIADQTKATAILHELIHTCTTYAMRDEYRFGPNADPDIQRAANTLHRLYIQAMNEPSLSGSYGIKTADEFVAELANPTFREKLDKVNLWDRILNAIKGFFGITSNTKTMLDAATRTLDYMLTDYDWRGAQRYYYGQEKAMQRRESETGASRYSMADEAAPVTEAQQKNADFNAAKTSVGSALKTLQGSLIKRYRDNVGKDVGGQIYVHKNYADEIVPADTLAKAESILQTQYPDFQYNTIMYDRKKGTVRFDEAPDFDSAREPIPGNYVIVDPTTGQTKTGYSDYIWHHKWQWVKNDYKDFDVADSWNWSRQWLSVLRPTGDKVSNRGIANGSGHGTANWNKQLEYFGLPTDTAESRYSITDRTNGTDREGNEYEFVDMPQYQDHTSAGTSLPNNAPSVYKGVQWKSGTRNLDIGGGQTEFANDYLRSQGVENRILDPYNRDADYNLAAIQSLMEDGKYDTVTCANVLNVIDSAQSRRNVILEAAKALQPDGTAYFQIYEGQQGQEQGETKKGWQEARKTATYIDEVKQWFDSVEQYKYDTKTGELKPSKSGNILVATQPKANLPKAYWEYEAGQAVRYSIEVVEGRYMPVLEDDNITTTQDAAQAYLRTLIDDENPFDTILVDAEPVYLGADLPNEYTYSEYTKGMNPALRRVKMAASRNLDEMVRLAEDGRWRENLELKHVDDAANGWYRYNTEFAVPIHTTQSGKDIDHYTIYGGYLILRIDDTGKVYLYDLIDLHEKKKIPPFSIPSRSGIFTGTEPVSPRRGLPSAMSGESSRERIAQTGGNVNTDSNGRELSDNQQKYFADSKARDENGHLLLMYHGTSSYGFTKFDPYFQKFGLFGVGNYFTSSRDVAEGYTRKGKGKTPGIYEGYVLAKNPVDMDASTTADEWRDAFREFGIDESYLDGVQTNEDVFRALTDHCEDEGMYQYDAEDFIREFYLQQGYDSITHVGGGRVGPDGPRHRVFITFDSEQFKLASNENPTGDPDIRYSISPDLQQWLDMQAKYGVQPEPPGAVRPTEVPIRTKPGNKVSETVPTVMGAAVTPESRLDTIRSAVVGGKLEHIPIENKVTERKAERWVENKKWGPASRDWMAAVDAGKASADLVARGAVLLNGAGNSNATGEEYADILVHYATLLRNSAQATQAANILKKMSPAARLYEAQKYVNQLNEKLGEKYNEDTGEWDGIKIDPSLIEEYNKATTDAERDAILDLIAQNIADQIRAKPVDWWTAIRYLNMLGNVRTQVRNVFGNAFFQPVRMLKDSLAGLTEAMLQKAGVNIERTTSVARDAETWKVAGQLFHKYQQAILAGGKYNDRAGADFAANVEDRRRVFNNTGAQWWDKTIGRGLEGYRRATNWSMDKGDAIFCAFTFRDSLARFMAANHTTWAEASDELRTRALNKAIRDAAEATYRDANDIANMVSRFARAPGTRKFFKWLGEGLLPFRKTPVNIALRAYEYSPLSFIENSIKTIQKGVKKGKGAELSANDIINRWTKTATGTGLAALGYALAAMGQLIGGAPEDDKEKTLFEQFGNQKYSLVLGNRSYTIDWAAPEVIPLFLGANMAQTALENGLNLKDGLAAVMQIADPLIEMSMLQGINDALENASTYGTNNAVMNLIANALWGYASQGLTSTLVGQAVRAFGENANTRMQTYVDKNSTIPTGIQRAIGKTSAKIPVWDYNQIPYIDAWGDPQENASSKTWNAILQFFSPAYVSEKKYSAVLDEVQRLYDATGDRGVILDNADKSFTMDGETRNLTADEYLIYAITRGQTAKACVSGLLTDPTAKQIYDTLSDEEKADVVTQVYNFANQVGKQDAVGYEPQKWVKDALAAADYGLNPETYIMLRTLANAESKDILQMQILYSQPGLTQAQVQGAAQLLGIGKTSNNLTEAEVAEKAAALPTPEQQAAAQSEQDEITERLTTQLMQSSIWANATPEQQASAEKIITSYAKGDSYGQNYAAKIEAGAEYGLDEVEYLTFRLALKVADANGNGSYTNAEVEAAIRSMSGLSDAERNYLWISAGKNPKSTPVW